MLSVMNFMLVAFLWELVFKKRVYKFFCRHSITFSEADLDFDWDTWGAVIKKLLPFQRVGVLGGSFTLG